MAQSVAPGLAIEDATTGATVRTNLFVSGAFAWLATVAAPTLGSGWLPMLSASAALISLVGGLLIAPRLPKAGRLVTMAGFLGFSTVTWVLLGSTLDVGRLEPVRAAAGAVGWMLFAFGWGAVRNVRSVPENDPRVIRSEPLTPRRSLPLVTHVVFAIASVGAMVPWLLAWRVTRPEHALLAHGAGLLCAIAMVSAGAQISVQRGQRVRLPGPAARLNAASSALSGLVVVAVLGVVIWLVRR